MDPENWGTGLAVKDAETDQTSSRQLYSQGFDADYYSRAYPESAVSRTDPLAHYVNDGWVRSFNPAADFDTAFYRLAVSGLSHPDLCPLVHYNSVGQALSAPRNRDEAIAASGYGPTAAQVINALPELSGVFDNVGYIDRYPDVLQGSLLPLEHYLAHGWREGRNPSADFDTAYYRETFMHNDAADICPLLHYVRYGRKAGLPTNQEEANRRTVALLQDASLNFPGIISGGLDPETIAVLTAPYFDAAYYLATYSDVAAQGMSPYWHYMQYGWREGRNPGPSFDARYYARNFMGSPQPACNPLLHYAIVGRMARRPTSESMSVALLERAMDSVFSDAVRHLMVELGTDPGILNLDQIRRLVLPLFSPTDYRQKRNLDGSVTNVDAFLRYLILDFPGGHPPGPLFSETHYLAEVRRMGITLPKPSEKPFHHWLKRGTPAGISPNPAFNNADYLSLNPDLKGYPNSLFEHFICYGQFEGRQFTRLTSIAGNSLASLSDNQTTRARLFCEATAPAFGKDGHLMAIRDFMTSGRLEQTILEAAEIEPEIGGLDADMLSLLPPWHDEGWVQYAEIRQTLPPGPFSTVILMPFCKLGGADFVAGVLATAMREGGRVLVIRTDADDWARPDWFPRDVASVDLSAHLKLLPQTARMRVLYELLVSLQPASVFNVNSRLAFETLVKYGERLARISKLYAYYFCADRTAEGIEVGYPVSYFSNILPWLTAALIDNAALAEQLIRRYSLSGVYRDRVRVIYTPAMSGDHKGTPAELPSGSGGGRVRKRVLWAGRLDVQKRFDLVQAIARKLPDVDFDCWGKAVLDAPPDLSALPPNLKLHAPFTTYDELPIRDADGWLYTSAWDGVPTILIELAAMGVPIVASAVGGVPELIDHTTGWPMDRVASADDYAAAVMEMISSPDERLSRGRALQMRARNQHSHESYRNALLAVTGMAGKEV